MLKYLTIGKIEKGFLLFEVMITVVVLSLGLVTVIRSFISCLNGTKAIVNYTDAGFYLERKMWDIENGLEDVSGKDGKYEWELGRKIIEDTDLSEAVLSVSWKQDKIKKNLTLATYLKENDK